MEDAGLKCGTFEVETKRHLVTEHTIEGQDIVDAIIELANRLSAHETMLVFFPGIKEVKDTVKFLHEKKGRVAYEISAAQNPKTQE